MADARYREVMGFSATPTDPYAPADLYARAGEPDSPAASAPGLYSVDAKLEALYSTDVDDEGSSAADRWRQRRRAPQSWCSARRDS